MRADVLIPRKVWSPREWLKSLEARVGPKRAMTAGTWIHDLCAQKQVILLCPPCNPKFDPKKLGYLRDPEWTRYGGKCDGCGVWDMYCAGYFWEPDFHQVRSTADQRRALARSREKRIKQGRL